MDMLKTLKKTRIFSNIEEKHLRRISSKLSHVTMKDDSSILIAGESGNTLYIIQNGSVKVTNEMKDKEIRIATLEEYQHFGEMALIDSYPNSASVTTLEETDLLIMTREDFEALIRDQDIAYVLWESLARELCLRIRRTNRLVKDYVSVNKNILENETFREFYQHCMT